MSHEFAAESVPATTRPESGGKPRKSGAVITVLVLLTVINLFSVGLSTWLMVDSSRHNRGADLTALFTFSVLVALIGLIGLGGAWATRKWGAWLYLAAIVLDRLVAFLTAPDLFPWLSLFGIVMAVLLVRIAERDW